MSRIKRTLTAVSLLALGATSCQKPNQFVPPPLPSVTVAHPVEQPVADTVQFVGTTEPTQTVDLRSRVNGYLEKILFEDGANVKVGQPLFQIEQAPYQVALDAARAAYQRGVASLQLAQSQYRRMEPLVANNVVTQEELDVQAAQVETTRADVAAAQAAIRQAELNLGYTTIVAPISGRIGRHMVDVGNLVRAEQTPLATIQAIDPIYVYFDVSENDLLHFMAMLRNNELPDPDKNPPVIHVGLANEQGFPHEGRLDFRELGVNAQTGTARRRGILPNPGWQLIPGLFVRVQGTIGSPRPRVLVDERAIGSDQRGDYLLVVNDKNIVEYRPVKLGSQFGSLRVVESGVNPDERIVINGLQRARPGSQVKPELATEATAGQSKTGGDAVAKTDGRSSAPSVTQSAPNTKAAATVPPSSQPANNQPAKSK